MSQDFPNIEFRMPKLPKMPKIPAKAVQIGLVAVVIIIILASGMYTISPDEMGVIQRFGKFVRLTNPGLHFKLPFGIEALTKVPVQQQLKQEFGFRTTRPGIHSEFAVPADAAKEAVMLTGDLNVLNVEWIVQYKIKDAYKFLFKMRESQATFRDMNEAVVRRVIGDNSVDEVLTTGRDRLAHEAREELQKLCNTYEIGIEVLQLIFQDINPPEQVKPSFNEVNESLQERERKINEAWAEYNNEIPKATGVAEQAIRSAEGYATERVNNAKGDASRFTSVYQEYARAPLVTRKRLYLETMNEVMQKIGKKIIMDGQQKNLLPFLNLNEEVKK
jgi:membrane protease subunit HflK